MHFCYIQTNYKPRRSKNLFIFLVVRPLSLLAIGTFFSLKIAENFDKKNPKINLLKTTALPTDNIINQDRKIVLLSIGNKKKVLKKVIFPWWPGLYPPPPSLLVVGPLKKRPFCGFPNLMQRLCLIVIQFNQIKYLLTLGPLFGEKHMHAIMLLSMTLNFLLNKKINNFRAFFLQFFIMKLTWMNGFVLPISNIRISVLTLVMLPTLRDFRGFFRSSKKVIFS